LRLPTYRRKSAFARFAAAASRAKNKKIKKQKGKPGNKIGDVDLRRPSVKTKLKIYMEKRPITG